MKNLDGFVQIKEKSPNRKKSVSIDKAKKRTASPIEKSLISPVKKNLDNLSPKKANNKDEPANNNNVLVTNSKFFPTYDIFVKELETWQDPLKSFIFPPNNSKMKSIYNFVKKEYENKTIFPPKDLLFNAFKTTQFQDLKVVIIGQDPYPNPGDACGMSFSVPPTQRIPGSLHNIYKCLMKDPNITFKQPKHGDLTNWAKQGVFLLNATLTVECKKSNSHQKTSGWNEFTDYVIKQISNMKKNVVFLLWGNFAIAKKKIIDSSKHLIITNIHPSPLAQSKGDFTASHQFSEANEYLKKNGYKEIDWQVD